MIGGVTLASPVRADDDWDDYEDYLEEQRERYEEWRDDHPAWRLWYAPRREVYTMPEVYPAYGGYVPGFWFNERYADPIRGYYYSRYGRRALPGFVPAYPAVPPPVAWGGYYPYPY